MSDERADVDVLVVGGGLAGLATAIAAHRVGRSVLVLEREAGPSEVATGITLWSFAIRMLRLLGLDDANRIGAPLTRLVSYSAAGRLLSDLDLGPADELVGSQSFDVHRAELQQALYEILGADSVRFGAQCVGVRSGPETATAELHDGSVIEGRILVGADGVHSVVRGQLAPELMIRRSELGVWRGILEAGESVVGPGIHVRIYGPAGVFGAARLDGHRVRWYAGGRVAAGTRGSWEELAERFAGWAEPAASIIAASRDRTLLYNDTPRFDPLPAWVGGRVALAGDAAHAAVPTLGVSGGLALADGLVLGSALGRGLDPPALEAYDRRRRPVGRRVQREAEAVRIALGPSRNRMVGIRDRLLSPPFDWVQRGGVRHLARGAEAPVFFDLAPAPLRSVNRRHAHGRDAELPDDPGVRRCLELLRLAVGVDRGPMELHSRRVQQIALRLAEVSGQEVDLLAVTCAALLHDVGLYEPWWNGGAYFHASADAARNALAAAGWPADRQMLCLTAIRRHHAPSDQSRWGAEVELLRRADLVDLSAGRASFGLGSDWLDQLFDDFPRRGFGRHLAWMLLRRAQQSPSSAGQFLLETLRQGL